MCAPVHEKHADAGNFHRCISVCTGVVAGGFMPGVPSASRRRVLGAAVIGAAAGCACTVLRSAPARAQQKTAKADVGYQEHPNGSAHCELCAYYLPPVGCRLVRGEVSPNGWCGLFQARTG
jgi:hypothetical protein